MKLSANQKKVIKALKDGGRLFNVPGTFEYKLNDIRVPRLTSDGIRDMINKKILSPIVAVFDLEELILTKKGKKIEL